MIPHMSEMKKQNKEARNGPKQLKLEHWSTELSLPWW